MTLKNIFNQDIFLDETLHESIKVVSMLYTENGKGGRNESKTFYIQQQKICIS